MDTGKILIVEDEPLWQGFLQEPLENEYALTVVSSQAEARAALEAANAAGEPFDLVTVDIGLDDDAASLEGEDILAFVSHHHPKTKCIVVTGHERVGTTRLRNYFKEFDVFDYIGKADFDLNQFKQIVDRVFYFHGYRLLEELGRGGMSTVYKAVDPNHDNRLVALKILHPDPTLSSDHQIRRLARFKQEVETIQRLDHPNIVMVFDYSVTHDADGEAFFVMEYLAGPTLEAILSGDGAMRPDQAVRVASQLCAALAYAHTQQVVHRDVKPSNIIMIDGGQIKVTDFGIAKVRNTGQALTRTEDIIGTLDYMPPEQILRTKAVDHRADIYAAGAVLYELLSGQKPYADALLRLQQDPKSLLEIVPEMPKQLDQAVLKALAREPDDRYQSAHEMAEALAASLIQ